MSPILAEGKTKILREGAATDELLVEFKDAATAFNGKKYAEIPGKGELNARISTILFNLLQQAGVPTCFMGAGQAANTLRYRRLTMIPLEVVVRNYAYGSVVKRFSFEEGMAFRKPLVEFFLKTSDDPQITEDLIAELRLIPEQTTLHAVKILALAVNEVFLPFFAARGIRCADFKLEFGLDANGHLVVGDELSPDNFRLRDIQSGTVLDKDVFRLDLADLGDTYRTLLGRMEQAPLLPVSEPSRTYAVEVFVHSRKGILNPESRTILEAVHSMGYTGVSQLQAGKRFALTLTAPSLMDAERQVRVMSESLLSNPVIEDVTYQLQVQE